MAQGEPKLILVVVDPHKIRLQHFLMLRWVLLCYYFSYFLYICRRPLNLVGLSMPTESVILLTGIIAYCSEYVPPQNGPLPLSQPPPRAL
jgi:hypothetical protein